MIPQDPPTPRQGGRAGLAFLGLLLLSLAPTLWGQETPPANRVIWFAVFPDPLPSGENQLSLETSSQFLRPDSERGQDGRVLAHMDGEEWQLTGDLALALGPGRLNLRSRIVDRSGGVSDQAIYSFHQLLGVPEGGGCMSPRTASPTTWNAKGS